MHSVVTSCAGPEVNTYPHFVDLWPPTVESPVVATVYSYNKCIQQWLPWCIQVASVRLCWMVGYDHLWTNVI
jgi:hypothetical protein